MSKNELQIIKNYLKKHLNKDFIMINLTLFASSILFAKKSNDELRFCVDFRKLNDVTKRNCYSLPLIIDLMTKLLKAKFFIKINICHAFNQIRLATEIEKDLITFRIKFNLYKYLMLLFGLINEPTTFQIFINNILMNYLNDFVIVYFDDILIYNDNMKDHKSHIRKILQKLRKIDIQVDIDKCEFHVIKTKFLKVIIKQNGLRMNLKKILTIKKGKVLQNLQQIQFFLNFINFYRRFIKGFSIMAKFLNKLIKKDVPFEGTENCQSAFNQLKQRIIETSILAHFDSSLKIIVESDSFDYVSTDVLFQRNKNDVIRSIIYFSKSLLFAECNYKIYDKKLLTIIQCFEEGRSELQSIQKFIKILIDHKNLKYFMTTKKLNKKQIKGSEFLFEFDFVISYQTNKMHAKADSLIKRSRNQSMSNDDDRQKHQQQTILILDKLNDQMKKNIDLIIKRLNTINTIEKVLDSNVVNITIFDNLKKTTDEKIDEKIFVSKNKRLMMIQEIHNQSTVNHSGMRRTMIMLKRFFYGSRMKKIVDGYIRNCHECKRVKSPRDGYSELLLFISISEKSGKNISLNFVIEFLISKKYNAVLMIVDRFFKMHHYIPCIIDDEGIIVEKTAKLLIQYVWKLHDLLNIIISNRGPQFVSLMGKFLCKMLRIIVKLFIAFDFETDGQNEIFNQKMKRYFRIYINYQQNDGAEGLFMAEYLFNACMSSSIDIFSFLVNYGFESRMSFDFMKINSKNIAKKRILQKKTKNINDIMGKIWKFAKNNLIKTQKNQKKFADVHKKKHSFIHQKMRPDCQSKISLLKDLQRN